MFCVSLWRMASSSELTPEPLRAWWWQTRTAPRSTTSPPTCSKWQELSFSLHSPHGAQMRHFVPPSCDGAEVMYNWRTAVSLCCPAAVEQEQLQTQRWLLRSSPPTWSCTPSPQAGYHAWPPPTACSNRCSSGTLLTTYHHDMIWYDMVCVLGHTLTFKMRK